MKPLTTLAPMQSLQPRKLGVQNWEGAMLSNPVITWFGLISGKEARNELWAAGMREICSAMMFKI
jgi:hypothetical protein